MGTHWVKPDANKAWITTYTGKRFFHLNPQPEQICIEDIAHALSQICRWTGHTKYHYSVAQHSIYVSYLAPPEDALKGLLHDASEAYLGDMNRPLKHYTEAGRIYGEIEEMVENAIFAKFGLTPGLSDAVKTADNQMLYTEKDALINSATCTMYEAQKWGIIEERAPVKITEWLPRTAEEWFLKRFRQLTQGE